MQKSFSGFRTDVKIISFTNHELCLTRSNSVDQPFGGLIVLQSTMLTLRMTFEKSSLSEMDPTIKLTLRSVLPELRKVILSLLGSPEIKLGVTAKGGDGGQ